MKTFMTILIALISCRFIFFIGCSTSQFRFTTKLSKQEKHIAKFEFPTLMTELELSTGFDRNHMGYVYSRIGNYYRWKGNYPKDLNYQVKALEAVKCKDCLIRPYIRSQLALSYYYLGQYPKAVSQLIVALKEMDVIDVDKLMVIKGWTRESPYYIRTLIYTYLSLNYYHDGNPTEAERYAREAIESSYGYKRTEEYRLTMALGLRVLGMISIDNGKGIKAVEYLQQSLIVLTDDFGEVSSIRFYNIINNQKLCLAQALYLIENYGKALETLSNVDQPAHEFQWRAHLLRGMIYRNQSRLTEAIEEFKHSINEVERARAVLGEHGFKISFMNDKQEPYSKIINALFKLKRYNEAFIYAEKAKARAFLDLLENVDNIGEKDQEVKVILKKEKVLKEKISRLQKNLEVNRERHEKEDVKEKRKLALRSTQQKLQMFYNRYTESNLDFASIKTANILTVEEIKRLIDDDVSIITYYYGERNLYVWAFNSSLFKSIMKPLPAGSLEAKVKIYRQIIMADVLQPSTNLTKNLTTLENQLSQLLLSDVIDEINTAKIYIIPHKVLHYFPFQALRYRSGYLVEKYQIGYCPSGTALKYVFAKRKEKGFDILALGNPHLGMKDMDLPGAEEEVLHLKEIFSNSKILIKKNASETRLKALASGYNIIHIASHAEFNSNKPLQSCLRLTASERDDGRLTAREVFNIKLDAYLVTLSGCETALGKITNGDEVIGFSRAFIYAGTPSILGSLWKVHDVSTRIIMNKFYLNLRLMDKFKALQLAQFDMLNDPKYRKPFFWAPFQIIGDYH